MFKKHIIFLFAVFLLLAACTANPEPAADPVVIQRSTKTVATPTASNTEAPLPMLTAAITPTPYTLPPTETPLPTPQNFYENVWVGGLLMSQTELRAANSSIPHVLIGSPTVPLQTADPQTAEHLETLPMPEVLVMAQGDFYYNGPEDYYLVVESIELVNLPYSAETPLDATYQHTNPDFAFDYPTGWFINPVENDGDGILWLNNVPPIVQEQGLRIGMEYSDPTQYDLTVGVPDVESIEAYISKAQEADPQLWDLETVEINGRSVPKITSYGLGTTVAYVLEVNGTVLAFSDWAANTAFMERIISTVR